MGKLTLLLFISAAAFGDAALDLCRVRAHYLVVFHAHPYTVQKQIWECDRMEAKLMEEESLKPKRKHRE